MGQRTTTTRVHLGLCGPSFADGCPDPIGAWEELRSALAEVRVDYGRGPATVRVDWNPAVDYVRSADVPLSEYLLADRDARARIVKGILPEPTIEIIVETDDELARFAQQYAVQFLTIAFLAVNLAHPGAACFWGAKVESETGAGQPIQLGGRFECCSHHQMTGAWPEIHTLKVSDVWAWLGHLRFGESQFARGSAERALMSLMHCCRSNEITPADNLWLSHALEAICETPRDNIGAALKRRLFLLLGEPAEAKDKARKRITRFYEVRSAFVHGSLETTFPEPNELLDERVLASMGELPAHADFGIVLVVASLQRLVSKGWASGNFQERAQGTPLVAPA